MESAAQDELPHDESAVAAEGAGQRKRPTERKSCHSFSVVADNIDVSISYIDADLCFQYANRATARMLQRDLSAIVGKPMYGLIGEESFAECEPMLKTAFGGNKTQFELVVSRQCATAFWATVEFIPDVHDGDVVGIHATVTDITELKQAQNRYERAAIGAGEGIFDWPLDSDKFYGSPRFWQKLGIPDHDPMGKLTDFYSRIHPNDLQGLQQAVDQHIRGETVTFEFEYRIRMPNDEYIWFVSRGQVQPDALGQRRHFAGSIRNVNSRKQLELALRDQVRQRDQFLAMLSHELRNPLNAVSIAAQLGALPNQNSAEMQQCLATIESQASLTRRLLDDLLDISRVTYSKLHLKHSTFDLCRAASDVLSTLQPRAQHKGITLSGEFPDQPIVLQADRDRVTQCINNLLTNGIKYTPSGGHVDLTVQASEGVAIIKVRDSGIGMDKQTVATAFDMFTQANPKNSESEGGLGLGLALVKAICELHGGTTTAYSEGLDRGSVFTMTLPLNASETCVTGGTATSVGSAEESKKHETKAGTVIRRVLIIDDLPAGRGLLARYLESQGYTVLEAGNGEAGLEVIQTERPDAVLVDIGLPDLSGYEVAQRVRATTDTQHLPLFALTGYGQAADRQQALKAGFNLHFTKPVDLEALITALSGDFPAVN